LAWTKAVMTKLGLTINEAKTSLRNAPDELRLSDIEDRFVCTVCGQRGADIRPDWQSADADRDDH
jgi:hypothetical protein